jgi:purine nucleoside permease
MRARRFPALALLVISAAIASGAIGAEPARAEESAFAHGPASAQEPASDPAVAHDPSPLAVKVLIVNMFASEAAPWLTALAPLRDIPVPGLPADYPNVHCNADAVCEMTTGMGHANAAASLMAVIYSREFDLRNTYFLIAGIAGIDPARGTIGTAAWARYVVDGGIAHEIDAREMPRGWAAGYFGVLTTAPDRLPKFEYRTEVYRLDEDLLQRALSLSRAAPLEDSDDARAYRRHYHSAPADRPPAVVQCDTLSSDTWWAGRRLGEQARRWTRLLTRGEGVYCTSQQEDNATLEALTRGAASGLVDLKRVAVLRSGSDFDRPYGKQTVLDSLRTQLALPQAFHIAAVNLEHAGMPLVQAIAQHWDDWKAGVPPENALHAPPAAPAQSAPGRPARVSSALAP